jgi:ADP-ribose pyrophosphatase YjhB (NUDIX family)
MSKNDHPLSQEEFNSIYSKVPRLTVEIVIKNKSGKIYLTKRAIEPCKGKWHLPGGTVRYGESMVDAVKRITKRELGVDVKTLKNVGYIEYPSHYNKGLDSPVGIVFEVLNFDGSLLLNEESQDGKWCGRLPANMHEEQDIFLLNNHYLNC